MFATGIRQLRFALGTIFGRGFSVDMLERLVADALDTWAEFGEPGEDAVALLNGPYADPQLAGSLSTRALRRTASRLVHRSPFYRRRFEKSDVDPRRLDLDMLRAIAVTSRSDLTERADEFLCGAPFLSARTTGTSGRPVQVWFSGNEIRLWSAMTALSQTLRGEIRPEDRVQLSISSRASGMTQQLLGACRLLAVPCRVLGLVPVREALDHLTGTYGGAPTLLFTYPSYLGALVAEARRRGLQPDEFRLRTVHTGGELLSAAVAEAAAETLGATVEDSYGATELAPTGGRMCSRRHLHLDANTGFGEVLDLATGEPAAPGELGTLVLTPYHPYRECMPVFRYDTRDVVRRLPAGQPTCELSALPAVSQVQGKAGGVLPTRAGPVTTRDLLEVLEALPGIAWPARFRSSIVDGQVRVSLARSDTRELAADEIATRLTERGVPAEVVTVEGVEPSTLRPLRCDLTERTFLSAGATA